MVFGHAGMPFGLTPEGASSFTGIPPEKRIPQVAEKFESGDAPKEG